MSHSSFVHFFHLESPDGVSEESLPISTLGYSRNGFCSLSAFFALSHSVSKSWHAFCHARKWRTNGISQAAFTQARPNGSKIMAPRWRHVRAKSFPCETKRVKITLPRFSNLTAADLSQKDNFELLFNLQGPVISECTIVTSFQVLHHLRCVPDFLSGSGSRKCSFVPPFNFSSVHLSTQGVIIMLFIYNSFKGAVSNLQENKNKNFIKGSQH